ncbi:MAG: amidohydrolase family protein [Candidatus Hydrogenedentes bacterium]|nr:amidohydrolase family protein [Candidatus Hydrogenedentota bacterium]
MSDNRESETGANGARPPVNFVQLMASLLVVALLGTNIITWTYFQEQLRGVPGGGSASAPPPNTPLENVYRITNGHDHLYMLKHLDKYLKAAETLGVTRTLFVASSEFTFMGTSGDPEKLNDWSSKEVLTAAKQHPGKVIPFVTMHPNDEDKVELLKGYVAEGAMGLKLYNGHSNFYEKPLDDPVMMPVYAYCEEIGLPILWHVNMAKYSKQLFRVLEKYPNLTAIIPHFGVGFWQPDGQVMKDVAWMLDTYPNVYVDSSFGTREILVGGLEKVSANVEFFQDFYARYQDKIIWGTDMVVTGNKEKTEPWIASVIRACRDVHEKDHYTFWMAAAGSGYAYGSKSNVYGELRGLNLPPEILKKIYETNIDKALARVSGS